MIDKNWKKSVSFQNRFERDSKIGKDCLVGNAISIHLSEHYSGSGPEAFGAPKWPHLTIDISFEVGQEDLRQAVAERIKAIIDELIPLRV